jgi:hypothetical protein
MVAILGNLVAKWFIRYTNNIKEESEESEESVSEENEDSVEYIKVDKNDLNKIQEQLKSLIDRLEPDVSEESSVEYINDELDNSQIEASLKERDEN